MRYVEQPFALDIRTKEVRLLPKREHRDYSDVKPTEFYGTVDLIARDRRTKQYIVNDWKTGQHLGNPATKMQLRFFALCLHLYLGIHSCEVRYTYIHEDGSFSIDKANLGVLDFSDTMDQLEQLYASVSEARETMAAGGTPRVVSGEHCDWCASYTSCPAKTGLLKRVMPDLETIGDNLAMMSPEQLGYAWMKLEEFGDAYERAKKILRDYATQNPIPLPSGHLVRSFRRTKTSIDGAKALALAKSLGASELDLDRCVRTTNFDVVKATKGK